MLKEHQELLAQIDVCESAARRLHKAGARGLEDTVHRLRRAGNDVRQRIKAYEAAARAAASPKPEEPAPETAKAEKPEDKTAENAKTAKKA